MYTTASQLRTAKTVLILGFGLEGKSTLKYLAKHYPNITVLVADKADLAITQSDLPLHRDQQYWGPAYLEKVPPVDMVIKTPGIHPKELEAFKQKQQQAIWTSQTQLFLETVKDRVIGVTGTKGKSTTASLVAHILKTARKDVLLVGNIGVPFLDVLDMDRAERLYAAELSCHQLSDLTVSPHIGVILNIYREHLDYYGSYEAYCQAKLNITRFQSPEDIFIYSNDQPELLQLYLQSPAIKHVFTADSSGNEQWKSSATNQHNVAASVLVAQSLGLTDKEILQGIQKFQPLQYRLEYIGTYNGIAFYDDALATIPEATILALNQFQGNVATLLAGGFDRGQQYQELAKAIVASGVANLILFPTTGALLEKEIATADAKKQIQCYAVEDMEDAVTKAYEVTPAGKICLLSPAASSFSLFQNYKDRSDQYRRYVKEKGTQ